MIVFGVACLLSTAWEVLPCWGGGYVQGVEQCPSDANRLYTYVDVGGPYRSDDAGGTWRPMHARMPVEMRERGMDEVRSMSVDPRDADSLVIMSGSDADKPGGFAYTRDGGETWTIAQTACTYGDSPRRKDGFCLSRDPFNPDNLAGGEDIDGVWISRDNGATWRSTGPTNMFYTDIRYDLVVTNRIYAAAPYVDPERLKTWWPCGESRLRPRGRGFFRSDDGGDTWIRLSDDSPTEIAQMPGERRLVGIFGHVHVRASDDGGESWMDFEDGLYIDPDGPKLPWSVGNYYALCAGRGFWLVGDGSGVKYIRRPGDNAWTRLPRGQYRAGDPGNEHSIGGGATVEKGMVALMTFVTDPNDGNHWFATDWFELWETRNAGETWTTRMKNIMPLVSYDVCFDPCSPLNYCCCLYDMGMFLTFDGGRSFRRAETRNLGNRKFPNNMATVLYMKGRPGTVLGIGARGFDTGLWRSTNGGRIWEPVDAVGIPALTPGGNVASALIEDERDGSVLMTVSGAVGRDAGGVYRSRDAGDTWTWEGDGLSSAGAFDYGANHAQGAWPRLVRSPDGTLLTGGDEWRWLFSRTGDEKEWRKASMRAPTWKRYPISADPFTAKRFLCGSESETYETTDGGVSWHRFVPLDGKACRAIAFDRHNKGLVAFGCRDGIYISYDGGVTLRRLKSGLDVPSGKSRNIVLDRGRLFIMTRGSGVYRFKVNLSPADRVVDPLAGSPEGERIVLWPEGKMPSAEAHQYESPFVEWFTPLNKTTDAVLILTCGGGYDICNWRPCGGMAAGFRDWLLEKGMTVVRLHYRTPRPTTVAKHITAWQDAQRAVRLVRAAAADHGVSPDKIGFFGYSAAGHLSLLAALSSQTSSYDPVDAADSLPCNVNWAVAAFPAYVLSDGEDGANAYGGNRIEDEILPLFKFDSATCPVFFMHGDDDEISSMASVKVYSRLHAMSIPSELHVFAKRAHDFKSTGAANTPFLAWRGLVWDWLVQLGFCDCRDAAKRGALVLSFDDRNFDDWERAIPLFDKYGAHATFFFAGPCDGDAARVLGKLREHGHSIGLHGLSHLNVDATVAEKGVGAYWAEEIAPQLAGCRAAGIPISSFAYPNCRRTDETDELFRTNGFKHVRGGLKGVTPYDPEGEKREGLRPVHMVDRAFFPASELKTRFRLDTAIAGEAYHTDIEDMLKCIRRSADRNEAFVITSHGIHHGAKHIHMKIEWLERILATAKECGVAVLGFDEL